MKNSRFQPLVSEGTYFQLFDYSEISELGDVDFCQWLATDIGVAAIPVSVFYSQNDGHNPSIFSEKNYSLVFCQNRRNFGSSSGAAESNLSRFF